MSEKENKKIEADRAEKDESLTLTLKVAPSGNQLKIEDPVSGKTFSLKVEVEEDKKDAEPSIRISVDEFRDVILKLNELGYLWTADVVPRVRPPESQNIDPSHTAEFLKLTEKYPYLPYEIGAIVRFLLMGKVIQGEIEGDESDLLQKAAVVKEVVITPEFRAEFFFNQSIKVPHFIDVDWEVVVKAYENNVTGRPDLAYGLLSLVLFTPETSWEKRSKGSKESITVAVNERLADKLIKSLEQLKSALQKAKRHIEETSAPRGDHADKSIST